MLTGHWGRVRWLTLIIIYNFISSNIWRFTIHIRTKNKRWKKINNHTRIVLSNLSTEKKLRKGSLITLSKIQKQFSIFNLKVGCINTLFFGLQNIYMVVMTYRTTRTHDTYIETISYMHSYTCTTNKEHKTQRFQYETQRTKEYNNTWLIN